MTPEARNGHRTDVSGQTLEQRIAALGRANETRTFRARAKLDLKTKDSKQESLDALAELVRNPPARMNTMKVVDLLRAGQSIGNVKARQLITRLQVPPSKTLGTLTDRQREALAGQLQAASVRTT